MTRPESPGNTLTISDLARDAAQILAGMLAGQARDAVQILAGMLAGGADDAQTVLIRLAAKMAKELHQVIEDDNV